MKFNVTFQRLNGYPGKTTTTVKLFEVNDERHLTNVINKYGPKYGLKMIHVERVYSKDKEFSNDDLNSAYNAGKSHKFETFEKWLEFYFKKPLNE